MKKRKFKFIDLFAGIGGFHIAMHQAGGECVFASEIDKFARITYEHNFKDISPEIFKNGNFNKDITDPELDYNSIPDFDILCAGFPCQPFSNAGYREGFNDKKGRGNLFFNIISILKIKTPDFFLLENVKNLKTHDNGKTYQTICSYLTSMNYGIKTTIINASDFGLLQNRERIYIVGVKNNWIGDPIPLPQEKILSITEINKIINESNVRKINKFKFPTTKIKVKKLYDINSKKEIIKTKINKLDVSYYNPPVQLKKYFQSFNERNDWENFVYNGKEGHFHKATRYINQKIKGYENIDNWDIWPNQDWKDEGYQHVYQWRRKYVRRNSSGVSPTLTANMGTGGHNVPLIVCGKIGADVLIRKLTPEECFSFQGLDKEYIKKISNVKIANSHKYKQAGNSVPINVIKEITKELIKLL